MTTILRTGRDLNERPFSSRFRARISDGSAVDSEGYLLELAGSMEIASCELRRTGKLTAWSRCQ